MESIIRDLSGSPRTTTGELTVETWSVLRRGFASPLARMLYWRKTSRLRRPMKTDVPMGEERLIRERLSRLADMMKG